MSKAKLQKLLGYLLMLVALVIPVYCFGQMVLQSLGQVKGHEIFSESVTADSYQEQLQRSLDYNQRLDSQNRIVDPFFGGRV